MNSLACYLCAFYADDETEDAINCDCEGIDAVIEEVSLMDVFIKHNPSIAIEAKQFQDAMQNRATVATLRQADSVLGW